jgi:hypothetical protein
MANLVIVDLVSNNYDEIAKYLPKFKNYHFLALTPSSAYYLEQKFISFMTFHDIVSVQQFRDKALQLYADFITQNQYSAHADAFLIEVAQQLCQLQFIDCILNYLKNQVFSSTAYITDRPFTADKITSNNDYSNLLAHYTFTDVIRVARSKQTKISKIALLKKYSLLEISKKAISRISNQRAKLAYDWFYIEPKIKKIVAKATSVTYSFTLPPNAFLWLSMDTIEISVKTPQTKITNFLTFFGIKTFPHIKELQKHYSLYFVQHGSYLYKNLFIKYGEIDPATINFVFNDYTKNLFQKLGAKNVYSVGSILFNKKIKNRQKKYDYVYITQGHDYTGNLQYIDFPNSLHSFDGFQLYQRHRSVIELFGNELDTNIAIRIHPTIISNGIYVPFWEIASKYQNITIDAMTPIHTLIEQSSYIISDYFTSEFVNREIHYKKDIILFRGAPTPLPEETIEDLKKMFILVETVDDLKEKIISIDDLTSNRMRHDNIIEYYSSKKCNTKETVNKILKSEFYGR